MAGVGPIVFLNITFPKASIVNPVVVPSVPLIVSPKSISPAVTVFSVVLIPKTRGE